MGHFEDQEADLMEQKLFIAATFPDAAIAQC